MAPHTAAELEPLSSVSHNAACQTHTLYFLYIKNIWVWLTTVITPTLSSTSAQPLLLRRVSIYNRCRHLGILTFCQCWTQSEKGRLLPLLHWTHGKPERTYSELFLIYFLLIRIDFLTFLCAPPIKPECNVIFNKTSFVTKGSQNVKYETESSQVNCLVIVIM